MENVIVTGGAGFIGSNFVHLAIREGWFEQIHVVDKLSHGSDKNNIPNDSRISTEFIDISEISDDTLSNYDAIINFAAESHVDRSIDSSIIFTKNNLLSLHKLLEKVRHLLSPPKFLQISTDEVYGPINEGEFKEGAKLNPRNPYSASKAAGELLINSYIETYGMDIVITRSSNNFGPRQYEEKLLPKMILNFLDKKPIGIYGDGKQVRDWTYVDDNNRGVYKVLREGISGEIYNISSKNEMTNLEITHKIAEMMECEFDYIEFIKDRPGHDFRYAINTEKINKLGWKSEIDFDESLKLTIDWYRDQQKNN